MIPDPSQRTMWYFMGDEDRDFHRAGVAQMAWSTDSPPHGCDWPTRGKVAGEIPDGVPADERYRAPGGPTGWDLYGLPPEPPEGRLIEPGGSAPAGSRAEPR